MNQRAHIHQLSAQIREEALRLGFSGTGIAPAGRLPEEKRFTGWLEQGFHGDMRYLERQAQKRLDPRHVLANARSLIVLAVNYYTGERPVERPMQGRISRYSWGFDYHSIMDGRLKSLLEFIQVMEPSAQGICYSDIGPIMEKVWGARTSLGWMGKHTNLISRSLGSWFFIGVILLDLELDYDTGENDFCGTCRRCIDACPTGAIMAPYVLDARRCISYLTIELRGPIPRPLRSLIGSRIFGCDDCQEACPWNRFAIKASEKRFYAGEEDRMPDLAPLVRITPVEFKRRFRHSPIWRATRDGFVRNVVVALGNSGRIEAVSPLQEALQDPSPLVRSHAAWALGRIAIEVTAPVLDAARSKEEDPAVLEEIQVALGTY
ncbi:MAG: tRNA epoxyqueuosine(34) reductase QueG [Acidobacteria bacterium]|nr:tRNA epoxyqueuosine(34) reductase QueG [Acidobacteriota bacterium]